MILQNGGLFSKYEKNNAMLIFNLERRNNLVVYTKFCKLGVA
jgi:hypothetical protein